jgi:type IV pilus assembly protein PilE
MNSQHSSGLQRTESSGFTMLELMIVVAIIAVLAAIAIPSYQNYVVKTNRSAAEGCMSEYANYMERFYTTNLRYDETPATAGSASAVAVANPVTTTPPTLALDCATTSQTGNNYTYTVPAVSTTGYTVQATPINAQLTRDTQCSTLKLNQIGTRTSTGTGTLTQCWGG